MRTANKRCDISQEALRRILHYSPENGAFTWVVDRRRGVYAGDKAGCVDKQRNRLVIGIDGHIYLAYRLAFLYMTGKWPAGTVDHINGNSADNCWANLRDVSHQENCQNHKKARVSNKSCGLLGVTWHKARAKWVARITVGGRQLLVGYFDDPVNAHKAYVAAKRKHHAGCTL